MTSHLLQLIKMLMKRQQRGGSPVPPLSFLLLQASRISAVVPRGDKEGGPQGSGPEHHAPAPGGGREGTRSLPDLIRQPGGSGAVRHGVVFAFLCKQSRTEPVGQQSGLSAAELPLWLCLHPGDPRGPKGMGRRAAATSCGADERCLCWGGWHVNNWAGSGRTPWRVF